jgi:uncharacterized protein YhbP (UPF0306 family)
MDIEKIVRENLAPVIHMSLATSKDNKPWVCEVHFAYDEDLNLYFRSLSSRRHSQEIAANPNVAGNVVRQFNLGDPAVGVYFEGTAQKLEAGEGQNKAFECIKARLKAGDDILEEAKSPEGNQFYKITVNKFYVFGRFGADHGEKYELDWSKS